ncbi:hypothetical protein U9M48_020562 [Paspalum notatum var. saurae]|uniref:RING-type E3 ubiquitin transferase n=1 Tax=Paspalum notatum var. saurae TaxID=547442 RepID=A0AAQ3TDL5_PASNO
MAMINRRPPSMGSDAPAGERAKEEPPLPMLGDHQLVDREGQERKRGDAGVVVSFGARPAVAATARPKQFTTVLVVDKARLCCSLCSLVLKRPIYQCEAGHLACGGCRLKLLANACRTCRDRGVASAFAVCPGLDVFYGDLHLPCPYEQYGCKSYIPFHRAASHQSACEHAPCVCPEPGCAVAAPPPALAAHLDAAHAWPVHKIPRYGVIHSLRVPASGPDRLLVVGEEQQPDEGEEAEEDREGGDDDAERPAVFVLSVRARGAAAAVSVACVRANARAGPQYKCVLWARAKAPGAAPAPRGAPARAARRLCMETDVPSCAAPGAAAVEEDMWLGVSPVMMLGTSREIHLGVLIEKL